MLAAALMAVVLAGAAPTEDPQLARAKAAVEANLRDPMSTVYRNLRVTSVGGVCGEYNAKNTFGGYTGFQRFAWAPGLQPQLGDVRVWDEKFDDWVDVYVAWRFEAAGCPEGLEPWLAPGKLEALNSRRAADGLGPVPQGLVIPEK